MITLNLNLVDYIFIVWILTKFSQLFDKKINGRIFWEFLRKIAGKDLIARCGHISNTLISVGYL